MDGSTIPVLCILDEKYHEKGNDGCTCIDYELPRIGEIEEWAGYCPGEDNGQGQEEGAGRTGLLGRES